MRCCPPRANASRCESSPRPSPFGTLSHHPFRTLPYSCQIADSRALSNHAHTSPQDGLAVGSQARSLRSMTVSALFATEANSTGTELLLSWAWSILQRFVVNEPLLILVGKLVPMLFSTALCANVCGESIANLAGYLVAGIISFVKVATRR